MAQLKEEYKIYFRRVWIAYLLLALSGVVGTWAMTNRQDSIIRSDINKLAINSCLSSKDNVVKFNNLIDIQKTFTNNKKIKIELESAKLHVPTSEECKSFSLRK